jgi:hypothetical protein
MGRSRNDHVSAERPGCIRRVVKFGRRGGPVFTTNDRYQAIGQQTSLCAARAGPGARPSASTSLQRDRKSRQSRSR